MFFFLLSANDENPSVQALDGTNSTEQRSKDLLRSDKEANPATADKVTYFSVSKCQGNQKPKQVNKTKTELE